MDHDLTYKTLLNSIIPNKLFNDMACEACSTKFTLFKRKRQCKDCLRFYCTDCVIRRGDRVLSCDNCSMLSRRPLIRSQVLKMKSKDLKQYLIAKKVSLRGCVEKEDLINILMIYANGADSQMSNETTETIPNNQQSRQRPNTLPDSPPRRSRSPPVPVREVIESPDEEVPPSSPPRTHPDIDIIEISSEDEQSPTQGPEPVVTEHDHDQETETNEPTSQNGSRESHSDETSPVCTEIPTWTGIVKITDVNVRSDLEYLNVKQLKDLLRTNRVDFRGCVERSELLDRASRLWDAHKQSREDCTAADTNAAEGPYEESLCKICWDSPIECVILECGHMACCIECGKQMSECPICRQYVVRVVRFFKA
ncbi:E3 ubiquitin-protein ligase rififylin [Diachasma alloeum]|uniref:E3 ubiquitin-protein ligase rififylin n=1 Tax=Diachasma alloeum TaxID=454923 RepID=UPI0007380F87|nr:E3 ubiquitin-protein ligase rififylin [Diachasma alloeum]